MEYIQENVDGYWRCILGLIAIPAFMYVWKFLFLKVCCFLSSYLKEFHLFQLLFKVFMVFICFHNKLSYIFMNID
jgi:hypothetical protein